MRLLDSRAKGELAFNRHSLFLRLIEVVVGRVVGPRSGSLLSRYVLHGPGVRTAKRHWLNGFLYDLLLEILDHVLFKVACGTWGFRIYD